MTYTPTPPNSPTLDTHTFTYDPAALSSAARWTCQRPTCGRAVLVSSAVIYGSATEHPCTGDPATD